VTGSQWLDIAIVGVALIAAISGWRSGAVGSLMSFVGVILGAIAGEMLVWGFTGHVISAMLDVAGWAQPWNTEEVRELDEAMAIVGDDSEESL